LVLGFGNESGFGHAPKVDWRPGPYNGGGYADLWGNDIEGQTQPAGIPAVLARMLCIHDYGGVYCLGGRESLKSSNAERTKRFAREHIEGD
jgi:hypothetical protein